MQRDYIGFLLKALRLVVFTALLVFSATAKGDENAFGKYLREHGYGVLPVDTSGGDNRGVIKAMIDGEPVSLMVDTGSGRTVLTAYRARQLKLDVHATTNPNSGIGGAISGQLGIALVHSFKLNSYEINRSTTINVLSEEATVGGEVDGLFGLDFLRLNAVILPVGARILLYKPGNGPVPSIESYMAALGLKPIPLHYGRGGIMAEGSLNGHPLHGLIDCGAAYSLFDLDFVHKTAGADVSPMPIRLRGADQRDLNGYYFVPTSLSLGPLTLDRVQLAAAESPGFSENDVNAFIGYDLLASHHAIIDLGHDTLWLK